MVNEDKDLGDAVVDRDVKPSGAYTGEPWYLTAAFGSRYKTLVKGHDPRVYPENESIRIALVDPASEVPVEVAEANARLIAAAPALYNALAGLAFSYDARDAGNPCWCRIEDDNNTHFERTGRHDKWCEPARAAFALVRGTEVSTNG